MQRKKIPHPRSARSEVSFNDASVAAGQTSRRVLMRREAGTIFRHAQRACSPSAAGLPKKRTRGLPALGTLGRIRLIAERADFDRIVSRWHRSSVRAAGLGLGPQTEGITEWFPRGRGGLEPSDLCDEVTRILSSFMSELYGLRAAA